jgi:hypothetical protein
MNYLPRLVSNLDPLDLSQVARITSVNHRRMAAIVAPSGNVAQVVECLPSKHKVLSSNSGTAKKRKKRKNKFIIVPNW